MHLVKALDQADGKELLLKTQGVCLENTSELKEIKQKAVKPQLTGLVASMHVLLTTDGMHLKSRTPVWLIV